MVGLQELRTDLAAALRWAARYDLQEGVDNHFSVAVPSAKGTGNRFLINPYGWHWSEITASSLVLCDGEGTVLEGTNSVETTAFCIHAPIHDHAPEAAVVMHTHMPHTTALTLLDDGRLKMCEQNALLFKDKVAYDDTYTGLALDTKEGERLARKIGSHRALMMASHGVLVVGTTIAEAFTLLYYLERAAMFQVLAGSTGGTLRTISESVQAHTAGQLSRELPALSERTFGALKRILDKEEPDYRN